MGPMGCPETSVRNYKKSAYSCISRRKPEISHCMMHYESPSNTVLLQSAVHFVAEIWGITCLLRYGFQKVGCSSVTGPNKLWCWREIPTWCNNCCIKWVYDARTHIHQINFDDCVGQVCLSPGHQVAVAPEFYAVAPRILRWLLYFRKICSTLIWRHMRWWTVVV